MGPPGHLAIGLAAKSAVPKAPLWVLLVATEIPDLLFFAFQGFFSQPNRVPGSYPDGKSGTLPGLDLSNRAASGEFCPRIPF